MIAGIVLLAIAAMFFVTGLWMFRSKLHDADDFRSLGVIMLMVAFLVSMVGAGEISKFEKAKSAEVIRR